VGQVVLVVEAYKTTQETVKHALAALDRANIAGVVLNKIRHRTSGGQYGYNYGYNYGYGYGYGAKRANSTDPA
jgi:protein-tyrosine kinase